MGKIPKISENIFSTRKFFWMNLIGRSCIMTTRRKSSYRSSSIDVERGNVQLINTENEASTRKWYTLKSKKQKITAAVLAFFVLALVIVIVLIKERVIDMHGGTTIQSIHVRDIAPDEFKTDVKLSLVSRWFFHVSIPSFTLNLHLDDIKIGSLHTPPVERLSYGTTTLQLDGVVVSVVDSQAIEQAILKVLKGGKTTLVTSGVAIAHGPISVRIPVGRTHTIPRIARTNGHNKFFHVKNTHFEGVTVAPPSGKVSLMVGFYNPSVFSVDNLGPLISDITHDNKLVGIAASNNATMPFFRGRNEFQFTLTVKPRPGNIIELGRMLEKLLRRESFKVSLQGRDDSSVHDLLRNSFRQYSYEFTVPPMGGISTGLGPVPPSDVEA